MLKELEFIRGRLDFVSNVVRDKTHTAFFYVLRPELMPILDTRKALRLNEIKLEKKAVSAE